MKQTILRSALLLVFVVPAAVAEDAFHLGGAARFNYAWRDYGPDRGEGEFDWELLRVDAHGARGPWNFSLQYRWYQDFDAVHHAWIGYRFDESNELRAGILQVPFGLLPYASHSFWFGSGYYLGLEDDYDLGLHWQRGDEARRWDVAVLAGDEYGDAQRFERYSFDLAATAAQPYRERERVVLRHTRSISRGGVHIELGGSGFLGRIEDRLRGGHHRHLGAALHTTFQRGPWSLQAQWAHYDYDVPGQRVALAAFGFPFEIAAQANVYTANLAYALPETGWFDAITCYNDLSSTQVSGTGLRDSWQNVSGCSFSKGPMFTYVDWITGRNMWFIGGAGVGIEAPGSDRWRSRLNINIGFYF